MANAETQMQITGRCYCGETTVRAETAPDTVVYCHCDDCRRACGAPVAAFAGFDDSAIEFASSDLKEVSVHAGATRAFCGACGSPVSGRYDYLPGQVFVPLGLLDQADRLPPQVHAHSDECLPWLKIADEAERFGASSRDRLNDASGAPMDDAPADTGSLEKNLETCG